MSQTVRHREPLPEIIVSTIGRDTKPVFDPFDLTGNLIMKHGFLVQLDSEAANYGLNVHGWTHVLLKQIG